MQLPGLTIGIIADDLTGACDTALQFFHAGCKTRVLLEYAELPENETAGSEVWSINTESRHLEARSAVAAVRESVALLRDHYGVEHFYKKMDSTLRGHFTEECLAVLDELKFDCAVIAPAYPQEDRRTVGGYQLVRGIPVEQTEVARDLRFPVRQSHIPTLIAGETREEIVGHIELSTVLRGAAPLISELGNLIHSGKKLIVVDACSNTDLEQIALAIEKIQKTAKVLPCGAAGLAQALSRHWPATVEERTPPELPSSPILLAIGTSTSLTRTQILRLIDNYAFYGQGTNLEVFDIEPDKILGLLPVDELEKQVSAALGRNNTVVISTALKEENLARTLELAAENNIAEKEVAIRAQDVLARISKHVLNEKPVKLVLSGGETATHICRSIESTNLWMHAEIEPSIPLLRDVPDPAQPSRPPRWIVTKSGNFGSDLALANIVRYLKQHETSTVPDKD